MKVKELIEQLRMLNPDAHMTCYLELSSGDMEFFEIDSID